MEQITTTLNGLVTPAGAMVTAALAVLVVFLGAKIGWRAVQSIG